MKKNTKWIPFGNYMFASEDYIVFVRKKRNGLLQFKTIRPYSKKGMKKNYIPLDLIDVNIQWNEIINLEI